ncbi:MAG: CBS domain-containing protein [Planctomycetaceae bacterium]|nr:CBS domain-containing protein [Planctomycetales bacterium]MCB9923503.1 CBS domain-containing protein [Planctomycetaceae bacterium]
MRTAMNRMLSLKVADVMSRSVVEVSTGQSMSEAAAVFAAHGVSSAPVIDEQGCCVGILSATDFLRRDNSGNHHDVESQVLTQRGLNGPLETKTSNDLVSNYMSDGVQSASPDLSLLNAARIMCSGHIHHMPVLDGHELVGVVSTMDVIAAMMNAIEEVAVDELKKT